MLVVHRANCSRRLVDALSRVIAQPLPDPFVAEVIAVQSRGMERWLAMELATRLGAWANPSFPFPRHVLETAFSALLGPPPGGFVHDEASLAIAIAAELPRSVRDPAFAEIARYLERDHDGEMCLQLSERVARVFDDYTAYRPEMLLSWERGADDDWQARLWRALCARHGAGHQAARAAAFVRALEQHEGPIAGLPARLCLFGVSSVPPLYLSAFDALARHLDVHLFALSPSREFFGDVQRARGGVASSPAGLEHTLLASLGRQGRELQTLLEERTHYVEADDDLYVDPGSGDLLSALQSDILHLRVRGTDTCPPLPLERGDRSVQIHACYGPMRELEVLHDQLLDAFEADPTLEPRDVIVMAPDIETYAPLVEAVFGVAAGRGQGRPRIPYSVSHRRTRATHDVLDALFSLIELLGGRLGASAVLDLLAIDCLRERFDIAAEELDRLRAWVDESGIRWGEDAAHREAVGQPPFEQNSWRFGLDRLLLGHAMVADGTTVFRGCLPHAGVEGIEAQLVGKLAELCELLFLHRRRLAEPRTLCDWRVDLGALLDDFVSQGPATGPQLSAIRAGLAELEERAASAGFEAKVSRASIVRMLEATLDRSLPARGFLSGGVTFCQLVPMRSIPFRVVCLIGMDDEAFPGRTARPSFDRMASARRPGDRSRRDDDRYMFLEALLSARQRLILTYTGQGIHDNAVRPPSVVVAELLDVIARGFVPAGARAADDAGVSVDRRRAVEERLVVRHRLHAFSPRYFGAGDDDRLFSYARQFEGGARALGGPRAAPAFLSGALPPDDAHAELHLGELERLISRPAQALVQDRLGLSLAEALSPLAEREPIEVDQLARWSLGTQLVSLALDGVEGEATLPLLRASGELPVGTPGQLLHETLWPGARELAHAVDRGRGGPRLAPLSVSLDVAGTHLTGTLRELFPRAHLVASYSRVGRRFELAHWIRHLVLCCLHARGEAEGYPTESVVIGRPDKGEGVAVVRFEAPGEPLTLLSRLIELAREARCRGVPFAYNASRAYASETAAAPGSADARERGLAVARKAFEDRFGDQATDAYLRLLFPGGFDEVLAQPLPIDFASAAERVFGPLFANRSVV